MPWPPAVVKPVAMSDPTAPAAAPDRLASLVPDQFGRAQIWLLVVLLFAAIGAGAVGGMHHVTAVYLRQQDLAVALLVLVATFLVLRQQDRLASLYPGSMTVGRKKATIGLLALGVFVLGWAGSYLVFSGYPLSFDEFWARADGEIVARGIPMARLPEEWREYAPALQPIFARLLPEEGLWASTYLPVNAALQWLGGQAASPIMAGASVVMVALIARRLMPDMGQAPLIAAILLATSSQLVITGMTPYSMSAHLFFDLVWLWLFIQRRAWAYALSLPIAALAMGLHQEAYFPLFALPFLLERFLAGQRVFSVAYVALIGAGFIAWNNYDVFAYGWFGVEPAANAASGSGRLVTDLLQRVSAIGASAVAMMGANLLRFTLWQNPVVVVLVVLAAWPIARLAGGAPRELRAMLLSIVGTSLFMLIVIPLQGHGWGYRYLHGQMAGAVLIATYAFGRLSAGPQGPQWKSLMVGMTLLAALLLPLRAWQAHDFASPYAKADAALAELDDAEVVIIDAPRHAYAVDLTRNDPWLRNTIKRMDAGRLTDEQLAQLCARYRVRFFTGTDADRFDIPLLPEDLQQEPRFPDRCPPTAGPAAAP